jgi:hypothetical protein
MGNVVSSGTLAGAVGLVSDRTASTNEPLCTAWLVANNRAASVASALVPFADNPGALRLMFPKASKECGVTAITFHPLFELDVAKHKIQKGIPLDSWESTLQKFNCAILSIGETFPALDPQDVEGVSKALKLPDLSAEQGLIGSLKNIELPLVLQTIKNSRQEGILYLCDDLMRPLAQIYFQAGNVVSARYKNLSNEAAIYQIVQKGLNGKFAFRNCEMSTWADALPPKRMSGFSDGMLIEAMRRLDELTKIKAKLNAADAYFMRGPEQPVAGQFSGTMAESAALIWRVLDGMTAAKDLWLIVGTDDFAIFRVLEELHSRNQISRVLEGGTRQINLSATRDLAALAKWAPLPVGVNILLKPTDQLTCITVDVDRELANRSDSSVSVLPSAETTKTRIRSGALLGAIDAGDPWHLLHEVPLLPSASGTPIFKDGYVVGMHCGVSPSAQEPSSSAGILEQMLWVDAVLNCLKSSGEEKKAQDSAEPTEIEELPDPTDGGCNQIARLKCHRCGASTFDSARECSKCKFTFVPREKEEVPFPEPKRSSILLPALVAVVLLIIAFIAFDQMRLSEASIQQLQFTAGAPQTANDSERWIELKTMRARDRNSVRPMFAPEPAHSALVDNDLIRFDVTAFQSSYVYLIYKGTSSEPASLIFPRASDKANLLSAGQVLHTKQFNIKPPAGTETVLAVASRRPIDWLQSSTLPDPLFRYASNLLSSVHSDSGAFVSLSRTRGENDTQLFLNAVSFDHP